MRAEADPLVYSPDYDQDPQWGYADPTTKKPGETQALEVISQEGEEEYYYGDEPIAEEDEEEGEVQEALTEDAYSLIYTGAWYCKATLIRVVRGSRNILNYLMRSQPIHFLMLLYYFFAADFASTTMLYSCLIVALQGSMLVVTLLDLVDMGDNPSKSTCVISCLS